MQQVMTLQFKGDRNYLHGSDIFNAAQGRFSESSPGSFIRRIAFKRVARKQCALTDVRPERDAAINATGSVLESTGSQYEFWIVETECAVEDSYPYDEDGLVARASLDMTVPCIKLEAPTEHSPIEEIIALTKRLSYLICPDIDGKWLFGQLNVDSPLSRRRSIRIRHQSLLAGRFSVNEIELDGRAVGTISFVVGKP